MDLVNNINVIGYCQYYIGIYSFMSTRPIQRTISAKPESNRHHTQLQLKRESLSAFEQQNTSDLKII